ncbi:MAG TPA: HAD family phosphatase [Dehalococcoidia bacterium]|nr:HAD family phosphatase [Dehalococcoidia bacterium]
MTITTLFFDFGGVLLQHADGVDHRAFEARFGLEERTLFRCLYRDSRYVDFQVGACTEDEYIASVRAAVIERIGEHLVEDVMRAWQEAPRPLNADMLALIARLRGRGYRTAIISNTIPGFEERLQRQAPELIPLFDVRLGSGDLRLAKPDPAIFHHALREMGVQPHESTFADDVKSYAEAASAIGMHGLHFTGYEQFVADLHAIGVEA